MEKIFNYILDYLKRILIITVLNFIIVSIIYLIKNQFTLFNIGHGLFIGGIVLSLIGGCAIIGSARTSEVDVRNNYITGYNQDRFSKNFIKSRNQNMNFTMLFILSGAFSILLGYMLQQ